MIFLFLSFLDSFFSTFLSLLDSEAVKTDTEVGKRREGEDIQQRAAGQTRVWPLHQRGVWTKPHTARLTPKMHSAD